MQLIAAQEDFEMKVRSKDNEYNKYTVSANYTLTRNNPTTRTAEEEEGS